MAIMPGRGPTVQERARASAPTAAGESSEISDAVGVARPDELVVQRDVDAEGHGEDDPVEHQRGDDPTDGAHGPVASLQHGRERREHQRPGEAQGTPGSGWPG
jgi:hypothetical protein